MQLLSNFLRYFLDSYLCLLTNVSSLAVWTVGDILQVCSHRWANKINDGRYLMNGACYWSDLGVSTALDFNKSLPLVNRGQLLLCGSLTSLPFPPSYPGLRSPGFFGNTLWRIFLRDAYASLTRIPHRVAEILYWSKNPWENLSVISADNWSCLLDSLEKLKISQDFPRIILLFPSISSVSIDCLLKINNWLNIHYRFPESRHLQFCLWPCGNGAAHVQRWKRS